MEWVPSLGYLDHSVVFFDPYGPYSEPTPNSSFTGNAYIHTHTHLYIYIYIYIIYHVIEGVTC